MFKIFFDKLKSCEGFIDWAVLAAVALGAICVAVLSANYVVVNNDTYSDFGDIADAYVDWARENRPEIIQQLGENMENNSYDYRGINPHWAENLYAGDIIGVLCDVSLLKDIIQSIHDFLSEKGEFSSDGYEFYVTSDIDYANKDMIISRFRDSFNTYYGIYPEEKVISQLSGFIDWQLREGHRYFTFLGNINSGPSFDFRYFAVMANQNQFFEISHRSNGNYDSVPQNSIRCFSNDFNIGYSDYPYYGFSRDLAYIYGQYYYDANAVDSPSTVAFDNSADSTGDFAQNPSGYADTVSTSAAEDVITHYSDGKTDVKEKITFAFPITGSYPTEFEIDESRARELGLDDILADSPDDVYTDDPAETPAADSSSFMSKILAFLRGFWDKFINGIFEALRRFFLPPDDKVREVINDIRDDFVQKIGYEGFDINAAFGLGTPPEDVYLTDYPVAGGVGGKLIDFRFVIFAVDRMRGYIRGLFALFIFIYNLNQLFHFIGQAGAACGAWESYSHSSPSNIEESKWNMFLNQAKNGRF